MDNTGYVRLTIWILMDKQIDKILDTKGYNRINIRICLGYVDGEIEGCHGYPRELSKKDILPMDIQERYPFISKTYPVISKICNLL